MMYKLNFEQYENVFTLPVSVVDQYITDAAGINIKVFMAIARHYGHRPSLEELAKMLAVNTSDVKEAVYYWINKGLLLDVGEEAHKPPAISPKPTRILSGSIEESVKQDAGLKILLTNTEDFFGRPITSTEQRSLIYLYEETRLPVEVILMAIDYCIKIDKPNIRYIVKVCESWADLGICDHDSAETYLVGITTRNNRYNKIQGIFGLSGRNLTAKEKEYIDRWFTEFGFDEQMVEKAYEICADKTGKMSFAYINTVLKNWQDGGINTPDKIVVTAANKPRIKKEASYNIDELAAKGLKRKMNV
ncbi:MAG: DnaD domain protein [Oscillospiraceae bacterium]|nr:DnaD domain protein [Oscillospiraceae bacterium]